MKQEKLAYLQKKYESRLNPSEDAALPAGKAAMPRGPRHGGRGGGRNMAGGKPKNVKKTVGRLLSYISHEAGNRMHLCHRRHGCQSGGVLYAPPNHQRTHLGEWKRSLAA